ncbi:hypothetical protein FB451DRAFT_93029 [Mycena latifolia]|nr:hypothetical protein FB451DRAFT_93029 [Mycena latifolia]
MPLINNSSSFRIEGGNFYEVSGDVNLSETHQHLTIPDHMLHAALGPSAGSHLSLEEGWDENSGRELQGIVRTTRVARRAPHDLSSRPSALPRGSSNVEPLGPSPSNSQRPRLELENFPASAPNLYPLATSPSIHFPPIAPWVPFSHPSQHPLHYQHSTGPELPDSSSRSRQNYPLSNRVSNYSVPDFEAVREIFDYRAEALDGESRGCYRDHLDPFRTNSTQSIHGGTFITAENVHHHPGETGIHILHRAVALDALHDSAESFPQPRCHPETRTKMLDDLYKWATSATSTCPIRWLYGPAGAGKSAIMQTLCVRLQDAGHLGGSFFFKRGHTTRGNAKVLFATLAYQLALHHRELKAQISRSVEIDPSVVARGIDVQLHRLIVEPCKRLKNATPLILILDGLDECENRRAQLEILRLICCTVNDHSQIALRILIASRPEPHIREKFEQPPLDEICGFVNVEQSFEDVRTYLSDEFCRIHHEHRDTMETIPAPWPSTHILDTLAANSSGYFVYAATVIKFIDDEHFRPTDRLAAVVNHIPNEFSSPFEALDQLYIQILSEVPMQSRPKLCDILCAIANFSLLPGEIDQLLCLKPGDVWLTVRCLQSVLDMPSKQHLVMVHHGSFLDFLKDPGRSSVFQADSRHRMTIARSVLKVLAYALEGRHPDTNRLPWGLTQQGGWLDYITSISPSAELVPIMRHINADFCYWGVTRQQTNDLIVWLKLSYSRQSGHCPQT